MKVRVPEDLGGELRVLPEEAYEAVISDLFLGKSQTGNPKITVKYTITSESTTKEKGDPSTIGETVLETLSLQEQAMWRTNAFYKTITGERIPQGDYDEIEFVEMLKTACSGVEVIIQVETEESNKGTSMTQIKSMILKPKKGTTAAKAKGKR
jgi:hypothetical protein